MRRHSSHGLAVRIIGLPALWLILCTGSNILGWMAVDSIDGSSRSTSVIYLNRDLSTGDLSQWTHQDYGLGTDKGSNTGGAGYLWYHADVAGRRAAGLTATASAHASPAAESDSVYLWEPAERWNFAPYEIWLRTSLLFPSGALVSAEGAQGEQMYQPTTGEWNWILEFHNDTNRAPECAHELANVALDVRTDGRVESGVVGRRNARLAMRIMGGDDCRPNVEWVDGPRLVLDHWYELLLHVRWDPVDGSVEWYVDNLKKPLYANSHIPTLYTRPGSFISPSYTSLTLTNYRLHAPWNSTIYLGPLTVGSTRESVLGAFGRTDVNQRLRNRTVPGESPAVAHRGFVVEGARRSSDDAPPSPFAAERR